MGTQRERQRQGRSARMIIAVEILNYQQIHHTHIHTLSLYQISTRLTACHSTVQQKEKEKKVTTKLTLSSANQRAKVATKLHIKRSFFFFPKFFFFLIIHSFSLAATG
jgi:hypothetical protein